jgi:hypothetical protein
MTRHHKDIVDRVAGLRQQTGMGPRDALLRAIAERRDEVTRREREARCRDEDRR